MWQYRDLTIGDTSSYFTYSYGWFKNLTVNIIWSPLYTSFYGSLLYFSQDAYVVTILHRLLIVLLLSVIVLALMRRLLPPLIAWLVSSWWVFLPINFNALYEVHLFAVIPVLAAWLVILWKPTSWGRGITLAILLVTTILVRNEISVALAIFAFICLIWEIKLVRNSKLNFLKEWLHYFKSYGLPLLAACLVILFFYSRSYITLSNLPEAAGPKHTLNMCQVYAFGYQQRHPEWTKSPWTECYGLMATTFGKELPTLGEMFQANPKATIDHFLWNIGLTPNGLQVLLFNSTSGSSNPDYAPVEFNSITASIFSIILLIGLLIGFVLLIRERHYWWKNWLQSRILGWLAIFSVGLVSLIIIPTQRPRPSYLFSLGLLIMACAGMSAFIISNHWPKLKNLSWATPLVIITVLLIVPNYYADPTHVQPRYLLEEYRRLVPYESVFQTNTVFLKGNYASETLFYVGHSQGTAFDYSILKEMPPQTPLPTFLAAKGINLFYLDTNLLQTFQANPIYQDFLNAPQKAGWKVIGYQDTANAKWMLLQKIPNSQSLSGNK